MSCCRRDPCLRANLPYYTINLSWASGRRGTSLYPDSYRGLKFDAVLAEWHKLHAGESSFVGVQFWHDRTDLELDQKVPWKWRCVEEEILATQRCSNCFPERDLAVSLARKLSGLDWRQYEYVLTDLRRMLEVWWDLRRRPSSEPWVCVWTQINVRPVRPAELWHKGVLAAMQTHGYAFARSGATIENSFFLLSNQRADLLPMLLYAYLRPVIELLGPPFASLRRLTLSNRQQLAFECLLIWLNMLVVKDKYQRFCAVDGPSRLGQIHGVIYKALADPGSAGEFMAQLLKFNFFQGKPSLPLLTPDDKPVDFETEIPALPFTVPKSRFSA